MIQIAFCFDENMIHAAGVAIASLLDHKNKDSVHYDIYCICNEKAKEQSAFIEQIVEKRDSESKICIMAVDNAFGDAYEVRGISTSTYLRLMLHEILPEISKIIYVDVDVLFLDSLEDMWENNKEGYILAGVRGTTNMKCQWELLTQRDYGEELLGVEKNYINAGILVMNLARIRRENLAPLWKEMANRKYFYQDQDILNITCKGNIHVLPMRYNVAATLEKKDFKTFYTEDIYDKETVDRARKSPAILHYTGEKPWNNRGVNQAKIWWDYVESQSDLRILFDKRKTKNKKTTGLLGKINRHLPERWT